jgi:ClpP class serine protease
MLQAGVDQTYATFVADVTAQRAIATETMQGQTFSGDDALARNLADRTDWQSATSFLTALAAGQI